MDKQQSKSENKTIDKIRPPKTIEVIKLADIKIQKKIKRKIIKKIKYIIIQLKLFIYGGNY